MFPFSFTLDGIWSWWRFSFRFWTQNSIWFRKLKWKLSPRSHPIQCDRKWKLGFLIVPKTTAGAMAAPFRRSLKHLSVILPWCSRAFSGVLTWTQWYRESPVSQAAIQLFLIIFLIIVFVPVSFVDKARPSSHTRREFCHSQGVAIPATCPLQIFKHLFPQHNTIQ